MQLEINDKEYAALVMALTARAAELRERLIGLPREGLTGLARKVWEGDLQTIIAILARLQCP